MCSLQDDIFDICTKKSLYNPWEDVSDDDVDECKERYSSMPALGTRVRRGLDWAYDDQDNYGPGTVVGHSDNGKCRIKKVPFEESSRKILIAILRRLIVFCIFR